VLKRYHDAKAAATFDLLPAIDLLGGRVVRLRQGHFDQETRYADDPVAVAEAFAASGARWLHIVDLDGARAGQPAHAAVVRAIVDRMGEGVDCEVAGGLRSAAAVEAMLNAGAARVAVGTAALRDPAFAAGLVARHGAERIVASIDVRDGLALGEGWRTGAPGLTVEDAIGQLGDAGVTTFEVTAIERDGLLGGPDLELLRRTVKLRRGAVIASGGVSRVEDLLQARRIGCSGAVIGRALYEGAFSLSDALAALQP
jgi:phosphoribosylformimino-5-aminoimidazole carboxamide ribotide isomerase